ncbi:MAG: M20/M25/M40 family metallo-hydrolase, partial [Planctomycetota bacterium]
MSLDAVLCRGAEQSDQALQRVCDWLRIPSVSTDRAFAADCRKAAEWAADHLRESGLYVELMETGTEEARGHPIVLAESGGAPGYRGPHVLFYGHYDVQPPDPLDLWDSGPFEPVIKPAEGEMSERVVARGACDDKGQVASFLEAMRLWKDVTGEPCGGVRFTVLLEGEEESGSVNLERFVEENKGRLGAGLPRPSMPVSEIRQTSHAP